MATSCNICRSNPEGETRALAAAAAAAGFLAVGPETLRLPLFWAGFFNTVLGAIATAKSNAKRAGGKHLGVVSTFQSQIFNPNIGKWVQMSEVGKTSIFDYLVRMNTPNK